MTTYYLDSSALVKQYIIETGSEWIRRDVIGHDSSLLFTSRLTTVEVCSALVRRRREVSITLQNHADALAAFREDCLARYHFVDFDVSVADLASELLERYLLRAYDAVQLASVLLITRTVVNAGLTAPTFLAADDRLLDAAQAERLPTDNPNWH